MTNILFSNTANVLEAEGLLDGRYRVIEVISHHPWGETYLAQDTRRPSQPQCLIQWVQPVSAPVYDSLDDEDAIRHLFIREAALLERLAEHPQIPQLLACFEDSRGFYLVQEFISGYPLSVELHPDQPWNPNRVMQLLLECLEPLAFVHSQGLRHGNLKPENLLRRMQDSRLVLINFDSLKQMHLLLAALQEQASVIIPTTNQGYQAPEQLQGEPRAASDVYALGMIAIQALTGVHPLLLQQDSETGEVLWQQHYHESETDLHRNLAAILSRMVQIDFKQRYESAGAALEDVYRLFQSIVPWQSEAIVEPSAGLPPVQSVELPLVVATPETNGDRAESAGATLLVGVGIGAVLSATVGGYAVLVSPSAPIDQGNQILERATNQFQSGRLPQAVSLAESIPITSQTYPSAQAAIGRWQRDWKAAAAGYQVMLAAYNQENWLEVLKQRKKLPEIAHWQEQSAALLREATAKADVQAMRLVKQAYDRAVNKDFAAAIELLQQIPEETSVYTKAQEKLREYMQKRESHATALLQKAYDRAIIRDFSGAILYLKQIPKGTRVYPKSQEKIQEYTEKQKIQAETLVVTAFRQAEAQDFRGALTSLEKIPRGTSLDKTIDAKTSEYTDKLYVWSDY